MDLGGRSLRERPRDGAPLPTASLSSNLPGDTLSSLTALRTLSLRLNHLSGPLPNDLSALSLASNNLSGQISPPFNNLTRLRTLFLESNQFSRKIPDIRLPNPDQFNVSFNTLTGSVPKSLASFLGTSLCGKPLDTVCADNAAKTPAIDAGGPGLPSGGRQEEEALRRCR